MYLFHYGRPAVWLGHCGPLSPKLYTAIAKESRSAPCQLKLSAATKIYELDRMWANAQRDGRPAEHRWRPLFNAAKFG